MGTRCTSGRARHVDDAPTIGTGFLLTISAVKRHILPDSRLGESSRIRYVRTVGSIPFWAENTTAVPFPDEEGHVLFVLRGWPRFTGLSEVAV